MGRSSRQVVARCSNCARLERQVAALEERLAEMERRLNRNSGNSSVPPAANPPWAPRPGVRKPTGNKPGGQAGHTGHHRSPLPPEQVDRVVDHLPERCAHCGQGLEGQTPERVRRRHQVTDLPARAVTVTEHRSIACRCRHCGGLTAEPIPPAVLASVCGERLTAAICLASARIHGSRRAVEDLLGDVLGAPLSLGTIVAREAEMTFALDEPYRQAREAIRQAPAKNVDETGWKRAGRFLWTAATSTLAVFHVDPCRNRDAMGQLLGERVVGTICTDRFGVYQKVAVRQRAICWAHLMRDFRGFAEGTATRAFGEAGLAAAGEVMRLWHQFRGGKIARATLRRKLSAVRRTVGQLLGQNRDSPIKRVGGFCRGLLALGPALWTFARVEGIEPTNNHAERMLRPAVCWRKTSLGSHSPAGCRFVERMLTIVQTLGLRGQSAMDYLTHAVAAWRLRQPAPSLT
jgi:transposase